MENTQGRAWTARDPPAPVGPGGASGDVRNAFSNPHAGISLTRLSLSVRLTGRESAPKSMDCCVRWIKDALRLGVGRDRCFATDLRALIE